jgi:transposase
MERTDLRGLSAEAKEDLRRRVVRAVIDEGMSKAEAVRVFAVGKTALFAWLKAYAQRGEAGLRGKKLGRPRRATLAGHQAATTVRLIADRCPDQLKLPYALWTRQAVRDLIHRRWGRELSLSTVGRLLKKWGFTPQKPLRRAFERDPKAVQKWLDEEYPAIAKEAKKQGAEVHWGDEMGLRSDHQTGTSYGRRGQTPVIPGTGQRFRCNVISTVTSGGKMAFMVFDERFTADVMIKFLKRLVKHAKRKVFLIVDGHPVHRSKKVRSWVEANASKLSLFRLPAYAPELNPDELLNNDVKSNALGRERPPNRQAMVRGVRSYLRQTQRRPQIVASYFQHPNVAYAA